MPVTGKHNAHQRVNAEILSDDKFDKLLKILNLIYELSNILTKDWLKFVNLFS